MLWLLQFALRLDKERKSSGYMASIVEEVKVPLLSVDTVIGGKVDVVTGKMLESSAGHKVI